MVVVLHTEDVFKMQKIGSVIFESCETFLLLIQF